MFARASVTVRPVSLSGAWRSCRGAHTRVAVQLVIICLFCLRCEQLVHSVTCYVGWWPSEQYPRDSCTQRTNWSILYAKRRSSGRHHPPRWDPYASSLSSRVHLACHYVNVRDLPLFACASRSASALPTRTRALAARFLCCLHAADRAALCFCVLRSLDFPPSRDFMNAR